MNIIFYQLKRPYLLANRLNNYTAADLLVKIGNASRQQMDEKVFYDAERWKHEGQLEAYKRYLKAKQSEMTQAKVNGNIKLYNFLNQFNTKLDKEINKNPDLLPLIAKVIIENDTPNNLTPTSNTKKNSIESSESNGSAVEYFQFIKPIKANQDSSFQRSKLIKMNELKRNQFNSSTSSSYASSSPASSASSSSKKNKKYSTSFSLDQLANHRKSSSFDSLIENIIRNKQNSNGTLSSTHFNTLLEMTNGKSVDNFVDSKQETDHGSVGVGGGLQMNDLFYQVALQNTNNYRTAAKKPVVKKVVKIVLPKPKPKTSTLAIIREESMTIKTGKNKNLRKIFNSHNSLPSTNTRGTSILKLKT